MTATWALCMQHADNGNGNMNLYSAFIVTCPSGHGHTVLPATNTVPASTSSVSPDGATTDCSCNDLITAYYSCIDPDKMKG